MVAQPAFTYSKKKKCYEFQSNSEKISPLEFLSFYYLLLQIRPYFLPSSPGLLEKVLEDKTFTPDYSAAGT